MKTPDEQDMGLATACSLILFFAFGFLAMIAVYTTESMGFRERVAFVAVACFFGWLSFFASPIARFKVMQWLPFW